MTKPHIAVVSLGGTITMTSASADGRGVRPSLSVDDLLAAVPALREVSELEATTLCTLPGASLGFDDVLGALSWATAAVDRGAAGVIVVQGTDTIEETAFLLDLYWSKDEPLIVTGAMRAPQMAGADGPANLLASVTVAGDPASRGKGVLVVLNDEIHAACRVRKMRASGTDAFASPSFGALGYVDEGVPVYGNTVTHRPLPMPDPFIAPRVALLETSFGDGGELLDLVSAAGFDGAVIAGFGVGHVSAAVGDAVSRATSRMPVVFASRTGGGSTYRHSYSFTGSESDLIARGAVPSGWLDSRKARILLSCLLAAGSDSATVHGEFALRGGMPGSNGERR